MQPVRFGTLGRLAPWALGAAVFFACFVSPQESPFRGAASLEERTADLDIQSMLDADTNPYGFLVITLLSAVAVVLAQRVRWPLYLMAVLAWPLFALWPVLFMATYETVLRFKRRTELVWYLAGAAALVGTPFLLGNNFSHLPFRERVYAFGFFASITIVIPGLVGLWIKARRQRVEALVERNVRLQSEQAARQEKARVEERNRIARDMHDVVANRIALMVMHAGALQLRTPQENDVVREAALITGLGRTALTELRDVLGVLRKANGEQAGSLAEQPLAIGLEKLTEQARDAGVEVEYRVVGKAFAGRPDAARIARERTMFRVAQESLTNVMKHAHGAPTVMTLTRSPECMELTVENEPPGGPIPTATLPSSGLGQVGLRERVAILNGQFSAGPRPDGGYVVRALLPNDGGAPSQSQDELGGQEVDDQSGGVDEGGDQRG